MKADIHVLGSTDGYRTIMRSPGLRSDEEGMLTVLNFGQVESADMAMLGHTPVVHGRQLPSGRYALTRYVSGEPDDVGRPTIELRTIVMDFSDFTSRVRSGLSGLVHDHGFWMGASFAKGSAVSLPRHAGGGGLSPAVRAATAGWQSALSTGSVAFIEDQLNGTPAILETVATVDAGLLGSLRWGVSILSMDIDVDLCTLLPGRQPTSHRALNRIDLLAPPPVIAGSSMEAPGSWNDEAEPLSLGGSAGGDLPPGITSDPWEVGPIHEPKRASGLGMPLMIIGGVAALVIVGVIGVVLALLFASGGSTPAPAPAAIVQAEPVQATPLEVVPDPELPASPDRPSPHQGGGTPVPGGAEKAKTDDSVRESVTALLNIIPEFDALKTHEELEEYENHCDKAERELKKLSEGSPFQKELDNKLEKKRLDLEKADAWQRAVKKMNDDKDKYKFTEDTLQHKLYLLIKVHMDAKEGMPNYEGDLDLNDDEVNDWKDVVWVLVKAGAEEVPSGEATNGEDYRENINFHRDALTKTFIIEQRWGSDQPVEYDFKLNGLDEHDFLTVLLDWKPGLKVELAEAKKKLAASKPAPLPLTLADFPGLKKLLDDLAGAEALDMKWFNEVKPHVETFNATLAAWGKLKGELPEFQSDQLPPFPSQPNAEQRRQMTEWYADRNERRSAFELRIIKLISDVQKIPRPSELGSKPDASPSKAGAFADLESICDPGPTSRPELRDEFARMLASPDAPARVSFLDGLKLARDRLKQVRDDLDVLKTGFRSNLLSDFLNPRKVKWVDPQLNPNNDSRTNKEGVAELVLKKNKRHIEILIKESPEGSLPRFKAKIKNMNAIQNSLDIELKSVDKMLACLAKLINELNGIGPGS